MWKEQDYEILMRTTMYQKHVDYNILTQLNLVPNNLQVQQKYYDLILLLEENKLKFHM